MPERQEGYIVEIVRNGAYAKASAIDPNSGEEVSVVGPSRGHDELLKRMVVRKLRRKLGLEPDTD
jgi:hypothetical protein